MEKARLPALEGEQTGLAKALCQEGAPGSGKFVGWETRRQGQKELLVEGRGVGVCPRLPGGGHRPG